MIKVICKTAVKKGPSILKEEVSKILLSKGQEILWIDCSCRQALEYAVSKEKGAVVLLQESDCDCQEERCKAWEIAGIRDIEKIRVIACIKRVHQGTSFMAVLYAGGIVDALYEDEADAAHIAERLLKERNRKECREYYGIRRLDEVVSALQVVEQETLGRYIRFIGGGIDRGDMAERFRTVAKKLHHLEICYLVERLPENVREEIGEDVGLEKYCFPQTADAKRKRLYLDRK